ncbi:hypothetical protein [Nocardioides cavernaquae]|nr:hypothetical protein [Nocardioides cavernaquae]
MTWRTVTVPAERVTTLLARIRARGGTVTSVRRVPEGVCILWMTASREP